MTLAFIGRNRLNTPCWDWKKVLGGSAPKVCGAPVTQHKRFKSRRSNQFVLKRDVIALRNRVDRLLQEGWDLQPADPKAQYLFVCAIDIVLTRQTGTIRLERASDVLYTEEDLESDRIWFRMSQIPYWVLKILDEFGDGQITF